MIAYRYKKGFNKFIKNISNSEIYKRKKHILLHVITIENWKTKIYEKFLMKHWFFSNISCKCGNNNDTVFKKEKSIEILKIFGLNNNTNDKSFPYL